MQFLPIIHIERIQELSDLRQAPHVIISRDWFGAEPWAECQFCVAVDQNRLFFSGSCMRTPEFDATLSSGEYQAGLWQQEVVELFIKEDRTNRYQEFNLAPSGAWWSLLFDGYRMEDEGNFVMPVGTECFSSVEQNEWFAALAIPLDELSIDVSFSDHSRANVCFILGKEKRQYLSASHAPQEKPDFHLQELLLPVRSIPYPSQ